MVKVAKDCGGKKAKKRKSEVGVSFCLRAARSWTDMSVPPGLEPNTIMEMYLPFAVLDLPKFSYLQESFQRKL